MWAPADLFTPAVSAVLLPLKGGITFFYENPVALAATMLLLAALVAVATLLAGRRRAKP